MTDREAFLESICSNRHDDTPRLAFADWLEERGEPDRAEFIRVQCGLKREPDDVSGRERQCDLILAAFEPQAKRMMVNSTRFDHVNGVNLHPSWWDRWVNLPSVCLGDTDRPWLSARTDFPHPAIVLFNPTANHHDDCHCTWEFVRGFISRVRCHLEHWREFGSLLCRHEPITEVTLINISPSLLGRLEGRGTETPDATEILDFQRAAPPSVTWTFRGAGTRG